VGLLSIAAAVLSSLQLFLNHTEQAEKHRQAAAQYQDLRRELEAVMASPPSGDAWRAFEQDFRQRWSALTRDAPTFSQRIHDRALSDIERRDPYPGATAARS
jgi:hypothetical protein